MHVDKLNLHGNSINDEDLFSISNILSVNTLLRELDLSNNQHVTTTGLVALSRSLQSPTCMLEKINRFSNPVISVDVMVSLASGLANNYKLSELGWGQTFRTSLSNVT